MFLYFYVWSPINETVTFFNVTSFISKLIYVHHCRDFLQTHVLDQFFAFLKTFSLVDIPGSQLITLKLKNLLQLKSHFFI